MKIHHILIAIAGMLLPGIALALDDVDRLEMKAQFAFESRDYDAAIQCWTDAIKLSPNEASIYINRGATYQAKNEVEKAMADYTEAIRLDPDNATARQLRAKFSQQNRRFAQKPGAPPVSNEEKEKVISDYTEMVRIQVAKENDPKASARKLATKAAHENNYEMAAACWAVILKLDPKDTSAWFQRAVVDQFLLMPEKAVEDCDEALRLDPKNADAKELHAQMDTGWKWETQIMNQQNTHAARKDYAGAVYDYNLIIWSGGGDLAENYNQRAWNYTAMGKPEKAAEDYTVAIQQGPVEFSFNYYDGRGGAYMRAGEFEKAAMDFESAAIAWRKEAQREYANSPNGKEAENAIAGHFIIRCSEAYMRAGKYEKAFEILKKELVLDPADTWSMNALAWYYATCPDAKFRDGAQALEYAKKEAMGIL